MPLPQPSGAARLLRTASMVTVASAIGFAPMAQAADHWLSGVRTAVVPKAALSSGSAPSGPVSHAPLAGGATVFDITISLDTDPQGDDDATQDDGANDAEQRAYEERIKEFANAVYQATNGQHKIGKVTIYRNKELFNLVDVQWLDDCGDIGPRARISGFGKPGQHIRQCNTWDGWSMADPKPSGYTMAHEWGHYAYGIYDEYAEEQCDAAEIAAGTCFTTVPRGTDTAARPSIMSNQWIAAGVGDKGSYTGAATDFLEFSTENIAPYRASDKGTNAHKRVFGESAWETLARSASTDPKHDWMATRTHYADLVAPTSPNFIVRDDESTAQSELDIQWVGTQVSELMVDVSGSMYGSPMDNARTAGNLLIDQLPVGKASIGVGSFSYSSSISQLFPITAIPDPDTGVKAGAKAAVDGLNASGLTAMYDALMFALNQVTAYTSQPGQSGTGVVYLLSDGDDNDSSATPAEVAAAYKAAGVAIVSLGYGSAAPTSILNSLAASTGGKYFQSPTTLPEIQATFVAANAAFSSTILAVNMVDTVPASATNKVPVAIDSTMGSVQINLSHSGALGDITFRLLDPSGADTGVSFDCSGATSCSAELDAAAIAANGIGTYAVEMVSAIGSARDVTVLVSAQPNDEVPYTIGAGFRGDETVYPAPMLVEATVSKGLGLTGLEVVAEITDPVGATRTITLHDDGKDGDLLADDGVYTAALPYDRNGAYSVKIVASNAAGNAQTTTVGNDAILFPGPGPAPVFVPEDIAENFTRAASATRLVNGVRGDDHADDPTSGACTVVADDNIDVAGRIDLAGDVDCFAVMPSNADAPLMLRATRLAGGMDAVVTVYNDDGTKELATADLASTTAADTGVVVNLPASSVAAAGHIVTVAHKDPAASGGTYNFSAGPALVSDQKVADTPVTPPATGGGGSMGPIGLLAFGLLTLLGLRRRRNA